MELHGRWDRFDCVASGQSVVFEGIFFGVKMKYSGGSLAVGKPAPAAEALVGAEQTAAAAAAVERFVSFHGQSQFAFCQFGTAGGTESFPLILDDAFNTVLHLFLPSARTEV